MPIFVIYSNWRAVKIQRFNRISNIDFYLYPKHWIDFFLFHLCCWIIEEHSMHVLHFVEHTKNTHVHLMIRLLERTYFRIFHFQVIDWISNLLFVYLYYCNGTHFTADDSFELFWRIGSLSIYVLLWIYIYAITRKNKKILCCCSRNTKFDLIWNSDFRKASSVIFIYTRCQFTSAILL